MWIWQLLARNTFLECDCEAVASASSSLSQICSDSSFSWSPEKRAAFNTYRRHTTRQVKKKSSLSSAQLWRMIMEVKMPGNFTKECKNPYLQIAAPEGNFNLLGFIAQIVNSRSNFLWRFLCFDCPCTDTTPSVCGYRWSTTYYDVRLLSLRVVIML